MPANKKNIKLALFDVDGTLLPHTTYQYPKSVLKALRALKEKGIKLCVATGRMYSLVHKEIMDIGIDYFITCNGQEVLDDKRTILDAHYFSKETIEGVAEFCKKHGFSNIWKFSDGEYLYTDKAIYDSYIPKGSRYFEGLVLGNTQKHLTANAIGGAVLAHNQEFYIMEDAFPEIELYPFNDWNSDIGLQGVSKMTGMRVVCDAMGIQPNECLAVGDGKNDAEMIEKAGIGIAVKGAAQECLAVADYVSEDIDDDGVAKALIHCGVLEESDIFPLT